MLPRLWESCTAKLPSRRITASTLSPGTTGVPKKTSRALASHFFPFRGPIRAATAANSSSLGRRRKTCPLTIVATCRLPSITGTANSVRPTKQLAQRVSPSLSAARKSSDWLQAQAWQVPGLSLTRWHSGLAASPG